MRGTRVRRTTVGALTVLGLALAAVGCTDDAGEPRTRPSPPTSQAPTTLTFGVYGPEAQTDAFQDTVDDWNRETDGPEVEQHSWETREEMRAALEAGEVPDVFLASRSDLRWLLDNNYTQPVDELLDERGIPFGDGYSRDALQAFSANDRLQCMPYAVSPMVIYYNTDLVDLERMRERGLDAPDVDATSWSFEQFAAAAEFASRPRKGTKGVHIAATLPGLSPFIASGGGSVFDDGGDPKSLSFSSDDSRSALERTLQVLRNPQVTLAPEQLEEASALSWFKRGKLGMIAGYRGLTPQLRLVSGLHFDVLPMPVLDSASTVGDVAALCLSRKASSTSAAADFMVHELSAESVGVVTRTGYLAPANLEVALSDTFLQPGRQPLHANVFNSAVRAMDFGPLVDTLPAVEEAVRPDLEQLVYGVGVLDLDGITERIDETSRSILDPDYTPEPSPTDEASESE
ncbi:ABC transporter substrate-binding protein [Nocardioides pyridinolyticus]